MTYIFSYRITRFSENLTFKVTEIQICLTFLTDMVLLLWYQFENPTSPHSLVIVFTNLVAYLPGWVRLSQLRVRMIFPSTANLPPFTLTVRSMAAFTHRWLPASR